MIFQSEVLHGLEKAARISVSQFLTITTCGILVLRQVTLGNWGQFRSVGTKPWTSNCLIEFGLI